MTIEQERIGRETGFIPPISYNEYMEMYGGTYSEFSLRSLAYMVQQRRESGSHVDPEWVAELAGCDNYSGKPKEEAV